MPEGGMPDKSMWHVLTKLVLLFLASLRVSIFTAATTVQLLNLLAPELFFF
jgi:hypothetical protein